MESFELKQNLTFDVSQGLTLQDGCKDSKSARGFADPTP